MTHVHFYYKTFASTPIIKELLELKVLPELTTSVVVSNTENTLVYNGVVKSMRFNYHEGIIEVILVGFAEL